MKRIIKWHSQHLEIDTITGRFSDPSDSVDTTIQTYNDYDDDDGDESRALQMVMATPFGLWKIDDTMNPYKQFKLWLAHTNFTINKKTASIIKTTPGVEVLLILSRYRFIIGVGELFDIRDVRLAIEKTLRCNTEEINLIINPDIKNQIETLKKQLSSTENKWAIYVFPNGKIDYVTDQNNTKQYCDKLLLFKKAVDHSMGVLIENNNG
jgi:hypothetical protein